MYKNLFNLELLMSIILYNYFLYYRYNINGKVII